MRPILPKKRASPGVDVPSPPPASDSPLSGQQQPEFKVPVIRESSVSSAGNTSEIVRAKQPRKVISNACSGCRRRRSKCDGALPCGKCVSLDRQAECHYDAENDARRKGALRRENDELKRKNQCLTTILKKIAASEDAETERLIKRLKTGETFEDIVDTIKKDSSAERRQRKQSSVSSEDAEKSSEGGRDESPFAYRPKPSNWTNLTDDDAFVLELIDLYFTWHHPFFCFFDEFKFREDFASGSTDNCSSILVNAVCTVGCHYSDRPEALADPSDPDSRGDHFFKESRRMLEEIRDRNLTFIQAALTLALRESTQGHDLWAWTWVALSSRMLNDASFNPLLVPEHERDDGSIDQEAWAVTYWGAYTMEMLWYNAMKQHPGPEQPHRARVPKPRLTKAHEESVWRPYDGHAPLQSYPSTPSPNFEALLQLIKVTEIIEQTNRWLYAEITFKAGKLIEYYSKLKQWQASLPPELQLSDDALPVAFYLNQLPSAVIIHLFKPFIDLPFAPAKNFQSPREISSAAAREGFMILRQQERKWGLRRVCGIFYQYIMTWVTTRQLDIPLPKAQEDYAYAIKALKVSSGAWRFGTLAVTALADMQNVPEDQKKPTEEIETILAQMAEFGVQDKEQLIEDSPYFGKLVANEASRFAPKFIHQWQHEWIKYSASLEEAAPQSSVQLLRKPSINSLLN